MISPEQVETQLAALQAHLLGVEEALELLASLASVNEHFPDTQHLSQLMAQVFSRERHVFLSARRRRHWQQGLAGFMTVQFLNLCCHHHSTHRLGGHSELFTTGMQSLVWMMEGDGGRAVWGM